MKLELKICGTPAALRGSLEIRQTRGCTGRLPAKCTGTLALGCSYGKQHRGVEWLMKGPLSGYLLVTHIG